MSQAKRLPDRAHAGGRPVQELICWSWLKETCSGGCNKLHLVPRPCYIDVDRFLWHSPARCDKSHKRCNGVHLQDSDLRTQVLQWLCTELGPSATPQWQDTAAPIDISDWLTALPATVTPSATTNSTASHAPLPARKKRSIDYVLDSYSAQQNIYLTEFSRARWLSTLLADPRFDSLLSGGQSALAKEITEAFAVIRLVRDRLEGRLTASCPSTLCSMTDDRDPLVHALDRCHACTPVTYPPAHPPTADLTATTLSATVLRSSVGLYSGRSEAAAAIDRIQRRVRGLNRSVPEPQLSNSNERPSSSNERPSSSNEQPIIDDGEGVLILDLCSGRGVTGTLMALEWPAAQVHMIDLEKTGMVTCVQAAVSATPNLSYHVHDLFASDLAPRIEALIHAMQTTQAAATTETTDLSTQTSEYSPTRPIVSGRRTITTILVGTHLCGALAPRLIELYLTIPGADSMILSPCCLKGALGNRVKDLACSSAARSAAASQVDAAMESMQNELKSSQVGSSGQQQSSRGRGDDRTIHEETVNHGQKLVDSGGNGVSVDAYSILCATLADMVHSVSGCVSGRPTTVRDANVLSPKNGFIVAHKQLQQYSDSYFIKP